MGYTDDLMKAGSYNRAEALEFCRAALPRQWRPYRAIDIHQTL